MTKNAGTELGELNEAMRKWLDDMKENSRIAEENYEKMAHEVPKDILDNWENWGEELEEENPEEYENRVKASERIGALCISIYVEEKQDSLELDLSNLGLSSLPDIITFLAPKLKTINLSNNNLSNEEVIKLNILSRRAGVNIELDNQSKKGTSLDGEDNTDEETLSLYDELDELAPEESYNKESSYSNIIEEPSPDDVSESSSVSSNTTDKETIISDYDDDNKSISSEDELDDSKSSDSEEIRDDQSELSEIPNNNQPTSTQQYKLEEDELKEADYVSVSSEIDELPPPTQEEIERLYDEIEFDEQSKYESSVPKTSEEISNTPQNSSNYFLDEKLLANFTNTRSALNYRDEINSISSEDELDDSKSSDSEEIRDDQSELSEIPNNNQPTSNQQHELEEATSEVSIIEYETPHNSFRPFSGYQLQSDNPLTRAQ